jgi:hypothetical protein
MTNDQLTQEIIDKVEAFMELKQGSKDGFDGETLDLVMSIPKLEGELYADWECLELIRDVVSHWKEIR